MSRLERLIGRLEESTSQVRVILDAGEAYLAWQRDDSANERDTRPWEKYLASIERAVRDIARKHRCTVDLTYESFKSAYFDVEYELETPDDYFSGSIQVRVSNHKQRYGGPVWSFEPDDDRRDVERGLRAVDEAVRDMVQEVKDDAEE